MAAANSKFRVENGLEVVGSANVSGNFKVEGDLAVNGSIAFSGTGSADYKPSQDGLYALGNTANRWIIYSSEGFFGNVTVTALASMNNVTAANLIPSSNTNAFGSATRLWTIIANTVTMVSSSTTGNNFVVGTPATFNALTGVANTTEYITTAAAHGFVNSEYVQYTVSTGNTAVTGLTNGNYYYVVGANATALQLSATLGGAAINLTAGISETGHTLTPIKVALSTAGLFGPVTQANVNNLRVYSNATVNGTTSVANITINGISTVVGNVVIDTDLLFIDTVNNIIGFKNTAPSTSDLITITGNTLFNTANTGLRFNTANATHNAAISYAVSNSSTSRLTFNTYDGSNSSVSDGGFLFNSINSSGTVTAALFFNANNFQFKGANVAHAGNFGIYNVSGTRVGP
jgi:hypothetical protein